VNELEGVRCTSSSNCFAVGEDQIKSGNERNQALRWNGQHWSTT
jgi:hypothetical protein